MIFGAMLGSPGLAETIGSGLNNMLGVSSPGHHCHGGAAGHPHL